MAHRGPVGEPQVEAVRDDGAIMVTLGGGAAVVLPSGQVTYLPKDSVYARGGWEPAPPDRRNRVPRGVDPEKLVEVATRAARAALETEP